MAQPNMILIMTDQQRGDCVRCDEQAPTALETPNLDQLAAEGTRFRRAYSATPSCIPARASLLTGMDPWHTGILGMGGGQSPLHDRFLHTLPGELSRAGYHTQAIGKNHFHPQRALNGYHNTILDESGRGEPPFVSDYHLWFERHKEGNYGPRDHGVDWNSWMGRPTHLPEHLHPTYWTAAQAIDWLDRRDPNKPFFLKVSFARPHSPYDPPRWYYDMYAGRDVPAPHLGDWSAMHDDPVAAANVNAWRGRRTAVEIHRARQCYYGSITFIDHQIGRLIEAVKRNHPAAWNNTWVVFLSDHGDMLGDHHLWRKTYAYEGSARVPLIVRPPDNWTGSRGQVRDEVVELRDLMPTLLDAAGAETPGTVDGQSMLPLVRGDADPSWRQVLHGEHCPCYSHEQAMHYLTDGRTKYIWLPYLGREQLFDLVEDPGETRDLASGPAPHPSLAAWRRQLVSIFEQRQSEMPEYPLVRDGNLVVPAPGVRYFSPHYGRRACIPCD